MVGNHAYTLNSADDFCASACYIDDHLLTLSARSLLSSIDLAIENGCLARAEVKNKSRKRAF